MSTSSQTFQYLLGKLSESESLAIEEAFFAEQKAFDDLLIAENDLTDAYVTGRLSTDDRSLFESRFLLSRRQHERTLFAETLLSYSNQYAVEHLGLTQADRPHWLDRLSTVLSLRPALVGSVAAVLLLAVISGVLFLRLNNRSADQARVNESSENTRQPETITNVVPSEQQEDHPSKTAGANVVTQRQTKVRQAQVIATLLLPLSTTRDLTVSSSLSIPRNATQVRLVAQVEDGGRSSYFARLETIDGQQVWHGKSAANTAGSVSVTVPSGKLRPGDFILTLKKLSFNGTYQEAGQFAFSIKSM